MKLNKLNFKEQKQPFLFRPITFQFAKMQSFSIYYEEAQTCTSHMNGEEMRNEIIHFIYQHNY